MNAPKTQRAWAAYWEENGRLLGATPGQGDNDIPVLVIPEAKVKRCRHDGKRPLKGSWGFVSWCPNCGATMDSDTGRWRRPRILRVGRASK